MRKIRLQARAENDLIGIWEYSFREWDEVQADKYLDELEAAMHSLAAHPELGVCYVRRYRRSNPPFLPEYFQGLRGLRLRRSVGRAA